MDNIFTLAVKLCQIKGFGFSLLRIHPIDREIREILLTFAVYLKAVILTHIIDKQNKYLILRVIRLID